MLATCNMKVTLKLDVKVKVMLEIKRRVGYLKPDDFKLGNN